MLEKHQENIPNGLETRFLPPAAWLWRYLERDGYMIRYGFAMPEGNGAFDKAIVVLPGLSEFCEKYFELVHDALERGYGVVVIDWRGQGRSSRYLDNPHKRHSQGLDKDADDLMAVIEALPEPFFDAELCMMANSMGGNIGLRFLDKYPKIFHLAGFASPMIGLHVFESMPHLIALPLSLGLNRLFADSYAPLGGDWDPGSRDMQSQALFSTDVVRCNIHNAWMRSDKGLRIGHVTNKWIYDAYQSCLYVQKSIDIEKMNIPCLFFIAGYESFVDNSKVKELVNKMRRARMIEYPVSRHEIWMEADIVRQDYLDHYFSLVAKGEV